MSGPRFSEERVARLYPIRTLVVSGDAGFLRRMRLFLGASDGFAVDVASSRAEAVRAIEHGADVVLVDADTSFREAAHLAAALAAHSARLAVITVAERPPPAGGGIALVLPKSLAEHDLVRAIERAYLGLRPLVPSPGYVR